jgi:hypothetical protein
MQANLSSHSAQHSVVFAFSELDQNLFMNENSLQTFISVVSGLLKPGGYFVGSFLDSAEIFRQLVKNSQHGKISFTSSKNLISFQFDSSTATTMMSSQRRQFYGLPCSVTMEEQTVQCYMVHTPTFINLAKSAGLELVDMPNSVDLFDEAKRNHPDLKKLVPSAKAPPNQPKTSLYVLPEQKEVLGALPR